MEAALGRLPIFKPPFSPAARMFATVADMALDALYTSAPILDYDEDAAPATSQEAEEEPMVVPGAATLAPEAFDAAILDLLVSP